MASKRAAILAGAFALIYLFPNGAAASVQSPPTLGLVLLVLPETEAHRFFEQHPMQLGLGVYPESRDPEQFLREIGNGAPRSEDAGPPVDDASPLERALCQGGLQFQANSGSPARGWQTLVDVFTSDFHVCRASALTRTRTAVIRSVLTAREAESLVSSSPGDYLIFGVGPQTPILVGLCEKPCHTAGRTSPLSSGMLKGGVARRPGIVTPYDVGVTILRLAGLNPPEGFVGGRLHAAEELDTVSRIDSLAGRLERDDSFAPGLAASAVGSGGLLVIFAWLSRLRRTVLAMRLAQAAVFVLPGWVLAEFIPSSAWGVRAIPIFVGVLLGAAIKPRDPIRTMARVGFGSAAAFAVLVAVAPLNPGGEPGLSIWGNPLVSWRFFGVQNVQAAIIASGIVVWGVLAGLAAPVLAVVAVAAAIVTGAPAIGANFVGVLTFVFGAAVAVTALIRRRASVGQLLGSGALAVGAFVLALLADAGSPVSHGGRAARRISSDGWSAAWDLIEGRLRLNVELIGDFSGGWIFVALLLVTLAALIAWGLRTEQGPLRARVAVLAGGLMALASMVLEDSGFYSGAVLWFVAADAWLLVTLASKPEVTPPTGSEPHDAAG